MSLANVLDQRSKLLQQSRVLIIGGSSGVGFGVAEALCAIGASVIISSSSAERLNHAVLKLDSTYKHNGATIQGHVCNMGSRDTIEEDVKALFDKLAEGGELDHVVYTAGDQLAVGGLEAFTLESIIQAGMVRFFGPLVVAKYLPKYMKPGVESSFLLTSGTGGERPPKGWPVVAPYLGALEPMARSLATELAPIRVNLVTLGLIDTELWNDARKAGHFDSFKTTAENSMITKRIGRVEDVAECYLYLMKDRNATGSTIRSDGGSLLL